MINAYMMLAERSHCTASMIWLGAGFYIYISSRDVSCLIPETAAFKFDSYC